MADGKEIDFAPYASGGDDGVADTPTTPTAPSTAPPTIDFSKYAAPATTAPAPKGQIDFNQVANDEQSKARAIITGAQKLQVDPVDYATAMHYETGGTFDPWQPGPTTKWGQHRGTIQYGEPQRAQYGVTPDQSFEDQVTGSNVQYLKDHGVKPGASFQQIYAAINGGSANKNLNTKDWNTGRTIADNISIADSQHRPEVIKRFGQYFNSPVSGDGTTGGTTGNTTPSAIQPGAPVAMPEATPEEKAAFDARFPVEEYSPGHIDPNTVTPEQNAQNVSDAITSADLTGIGQAAAKGEKYVDPATQLVLEGGYKQAPDQTNVPQGSTRVTKDGQTYITKQVGDQYSIIPENHTPAQATDADYQQYVDYQNSQKQPVLPRDQFDAQLAQPDTTKDHVNGVSVKTGPDGQPQVNAGDDSQQNVQRLLTRWQTAPKPLDDEHLASTDVSYHIDIPKGVDPSSYVQNVMAKRLQDEWGFTPEQAKESSVSAIGQGPTKDDREVIVRLNRGDVAKVVGLDKVRQDYQGEKGEAYKDFALQQNEAADARAAAKPLTDNPFVRPTGNPLMDQARANIAADPFNAGTDKDVQNEYERLQRTTPGEDEKQAADTVGSWLSKLDVSGVDTGVVKGAAWLGDIVTGAAKLSPVGLLASYVTGNNKDPLSDTISRASNDARLVAKSSADHDTFVYEIGGQQIRPRAAGEALGQAGIQVPVYIALSELPGGATMAMAATEGLGSVGRGDNALDVGTNTIKGGALGFLFSAAPRIGQFAEDLAGRAMVNPVFEAGKNLSTGQILASKLVGTTAELGTIGGGTFALEKASGASNEDAFNSAVVNTLFGLTKHIPLSSMVGKTYRMHDGATTADVTVDPDGSVKLLKGEVPPGAVDAEFDVSKVIDMKPDASGVYRAESDRASGDKQSLVKGTLDEAPAKRIETPLPDAVARIGLDTRAQKIGQMLSDGQPATLQEIAKSTKYNPAKINQTIELLYGAGKIEILPDGRVRLVEPLDKGTSLYDQFDSQGRVAPQSSEQATGKTAPVVSPNGNAPTVSENANAAGTTTEKSADKTTTPVAPTITPEQQAEAQQSAGITTQVSPEQAARDAGSVTKDGVTYTRQDPLPETLPKGNTGKVKFAENESPDFTYRIISADHLQPAHINGVPNNNNFIPEAQPKVRTDAASKKAADTIAARINLDEVGESPNAYAGAPVINDRGEVIQGNNRAAGIKLSYGQSDDYKKQLEAQAAKFGFTPEQVNAVKNPVLVRQVSADDNKAIQLGNFDELDTTSGGVRRIDPGKIAARIPHEDKAKILSDVFLNAPEDASLTDLIRDNQAQVVNHLKPYLTETQQQSMVENGKLTPKAVEDVKDTFTHFLLSGGGNNLPELFDTLPDKAQKGLTASLPAIFSTPEHATLVTDTQNAIKAANTFAELRDADKNLNWDTWQRQPDMITGGLAPKEIFTPTELAIAQRLLDARKASDIRSTFADYAKLVNGKEADLFGEATPGVSKADAVKEIFNVVHEERANPSTTSTGGESRTDAAAGPQTANVTPSGQVAASTQTQGTDSGSGHNAESRDPSLSAESRTQLQPATEQPERTTSAEGRTAGPADRNALDPVTTARVLYGRERGMTDSDIAQRYGIDPEDVASLSSLPAVGQGGQTKFALIKNFVPSKTATPEEKADKVAMTNDLISEMGIPSEDRLTRDSSPGEIKTALDAATLAISHEMGKERSSHLDNSDWLKWLDAHVARLSHDTTSGILDALGHQIDHSETKVTPFIADKRLDDVLTRIDTRYGLDRFTDLDGIPNSDLKKEILQLGYSYGLKQTAIKRAYEAACKGFQRRISEGVGDGTPARGSSSDTPQVATQSGSGNEEELGNIQFASSGPTVQTDTPAFKKWFGDSKVVDEKGDPRVVYHWTPESFDSFDPSHIGSNASTVLDGFFFADKPPLSSGRTDGENILPVYLSIKNPVYLDVTKSDFDTVGAQEAIQHFLQNGTTDYLEQYLQDSEGLTAPQIERVLRKWESADGVVLKNTQYAGHSDEYVAFKPEQIKSAIGNNGDFDPNNPSILFGTTFDQTDLFGNLLTPQTEQPSMFDMGTPVEAKKSVASNLSNVIAPATANYLNSLAESPNKAVAKAANTVIGSSKYARSAEAKKVIEDAADALDTFARAEQARTTVGNILAQQNLDGRTVAETITPQAASFARAMENGDLGRTLNGALSDGNIQFQAAWHGSPHRFDKFDSSKIGTGEGAQAYGHGIYFTDSESVADYYKRSLAEKKVLYKGEDVSHNPELRQAVETIHFLGGKRPAIERIKAAQEWAKANPDFPGVDLDSVLQYVRQIKTSDISLGSKGAKYKVDLKPAPEDYLLWDKPLSEQSEKVKKALLGDAKKRANDTNSPDWLTFENLAEDFKRPDNRGKDIYHLLSSQEVTGWSQPEASDYLKSLGIRGIKYLDGSSRGKGEGSYNYVIFDHNDVDIQEVHFDIPKEKITLERRKSRKMMLDLKGLTQPEMVAQADIQANGGVLQPKNMQGLTVLHYAVQGIDPGKYRNINFAGAYMDAAAAKALQNVVNGAIDNALASGQKKSADKLSQVADAIQNAIDPTHGDLVVSLSDPKLPNLSKTTLQEELSHRNNARSGARNIFVEMARTPAIEKSLANLGPGYARIGVTSAVDEVIAKSFRDDAESELGLSGAEIDDNLDALFTALENNGLDIAAYAKGVENVSQRGNQFASHRRGERNVATQPVGTTEGDIPAGDTSLARQAGADGGKGTRTLGQDDRLARFQPRELSQTGNGQGEVAFAKNTLVRKSLNALDNLFSKDGTSPTRALEAAVNKNLQQLKKDDEDSYEQALKLVGTQAQVTVEALTGGTISLGMAQALYQKNVTELAVTMEMAGLAEKVLPHVPTPTTVAGRTASVIRIGNQPYAVPVSIAREIRKALEKAPDPNVVQKIIGKANTLGFAGGIASLFHAANIVGSIIGTTPYVGTDIASRTIGNLPATKFLTTLVHLALNNPEKVDPQMLRDMADAGVIPSNYGRVSYSQRLSAKLAGERKLLSAKPFLNGPKGLDIRGRITMWKIANHIDPTASNADKAEFVHQLGLYSRALESDLANGVKSWGIGPAYTAGSTMLKNGVLMWLNKSPMPSEGLPIAQRAALRLQQQLSAGALGMLAMWIVLSLLYRKKYPWKDPESRFLQIPLNDEDRNTPLAKTLWGDDQNKTAYVGLGFFSPLTERGARSVGLTGAYETSILDGSKEQMTEAGIRDSINSIAHPFEGPLVNAGFIGLTGKEPQLQGFRDSGKFGAKLWSAHLPKDAGIGRSLLEGGLNINPLLASVAHMAGVNRDDNSPDTIENAEAHQYLDSILNMTVPRLVKSASDRGKARGAIIKEKREIESQR